MCLRSLSGRVRYLRRRLWVFVLLLLCCRCPEHVGALGGLGSASARERPPTAEVDRDGERNWRFPTRSPLPVTEPQHLEGHLNSGLVSRP